MWILRYEIGMSDAEKFVILAVEGFCLKWYWNFIFPYFTEVNWARVGFGQFLSSNAHRPTSDLLSDILRIYLSVNHRCVIILIGSCVYSFSALRTLQF